MFIYSSTYLLVALSIDRWEAVVKPLAFTKNRNRGCYLAAGAWGLALVSPTPLLLKTRIHEIQGLPQCWIDYDELGWKLYMVYLTSSLLVVPALIIAVCYVHIVYTIWRKGKLGETKRRKSEMPVKRTRPISATKALAASQSQVAPSSQPAGE